MPPEEPSDEAGAPVDPAAGAEGEMPDSTEGADQRDGPAPPDDPGKADYYIHEDGTSEIVFAVEEGRVLTIREYHFEDDFAAAVADATYQGEHEGVAQLPGVEAFQTESEAYQGADTRETDRGDE